jgi:hypothetical protein
MQVIWHCGIYIQSTMWLGCGRSVNEKGCFLSNEWGTLAFFFVYSLSLSLSFSLSPSLWLFLIFLNWFLLPYFHRIVFACRSLTHLLHFRVIITCWSNVELNSTSLFILLDPVSSSKRQIMLQCFMLVFPKLPPSSCCCGNFKGLDFLENWTRLLEFTMTIWTSKCWNK